jgi:predicted dehydrogenase
VEKSDVVALMRRDVDKAKDYAQRHGIGKWYGNAQELISDPQVNAVYVATPPGSHAEYAIAAMKAGKPVYVEKPMAASYEECLQINRVSEETGIPCFVAYYRRTLPYFLKIKQLIDEGVMGDISTVHIHFAIPPYATDYDRNNLPWRVQKEIAGAGYFYDLAYHQFDLLDYLLGEITQVHGFAANVAELYAVEDTVTAAFRFQSGVLASGSWSFTAPKDTRIDRIDLVGTNGKLSFSTFDFSPILLETSDGTRELREENPENIQYYLIQSMLNFLNGRGDVPVSTGITAIRTNYVMDRILGNV